MVSKLAILPLLILPACASPGENARLTQDALAHDRAACIARGDQLGTDNYLRCMVELGHRAGYLVARADDGQVVFALQEARGISQFITTGPD
jgi:hypothetical protein